MRCKSIFQFFWIKRIDRVIESIIRYDRSNWSIELIDRTDRSIIDQFSILNIFFCSIFSQSRNGIKRKLYFWPIFCKLIAQYCTTTIKKSISLTRRSSWIDNDSNDTINTLHCLRLGAILLFFLLLNFFSALWVVLVWYNWAVLKNFFSAWLTRLIRLAYKTCFTSLSPSTW